jgi:hypothetical protein
MKRTNIYSIQNTLLVFVITFTFITSGCKKSKDDPATAGVYDSGVFIANEGPYGSGTGTVSHYDRNSKTVTNDIYALANEVPLGNIVQSVNIFNGRAYIIVNNADKIETVNQGDFKSIGTIGGLTQPRNILQIDNVKAYVTEWGTNGLTGAIKVIDIASNSISKTITLGRKGPEEMIKKGETIYVTCKGGIGNDSVLAIINSTSDVLNNTINVGPNPDDIVEDINGNFWILCKGKYKSDYSALEQTGRLVKFNPNTNTVDLSLTFPLGSDPFAQPSGLCLNTDKNTLYYNYDGKVYTQSINASTIEATVFVSRSFYNLAIDPSTNIMYGCDAGNFTSNGKIIRYQSTGGNPIDSFEVGIIPGSIFFK